MSLLSVLGVSKSFRGVRALREVSFEVPEGAVVGLIGPNGAGKTTLFGVIAGGLVPDAGSVRFRGVDITRWPDRRRARAGLVRTFQLMRPFGALSVLDNVAVAAQVRHGRRGPAVRAAADIVEQVGLETYRDRQARTLPTVALKRLELARALALRPSLLLLDEVLAGLAPNERAPVLSLLRGLRADGVTLVFVEHVMAAVMSLSDHLMVLDGGRLIASGPPEQVTRDPRVVEAYLGDVAVGREEG